MNLFEYMIEEGIMEAQEPAHFQTAIVSAFTKFDMYLRGLPTYVRSKKRLGWLFGSKPQSLHKSGSTACCCVLTNKHLVISNVGDSRLFVSNKDQASPRFVSSDHKPSDVEEKKRIERNGLRVINNRVAGDLAISRTLGDFGFKNYSLSPHEQAVSCVPDVDVIPFLDTDEFIVLASDGIWDVVSVDQVQAFVRERKAQGMMPKAISEQINEWCIGLGSRDNCTCIVAFLNPLELA